MWPEQRENLRHAVPSSIQPNFSQRLRLAVWPRRIGLLVSLRDAASDAAEGRARTKLRSVGPLACSLRSRPSSALKWRWWQR